MAVAEASFKISMDSISFGLISFNVPPDLLIGTPSTTIYGPELALMEFWPRTKASGASPGMEDVCVIVTPAAAP